MRDVVWTCDGLVHGVLEVFVPHGMVHGVLAWCIAWCVNAPRQTHLRFLSFSIFENFETSKITELLSPFNQHVLAWCIAWGVGTRPSFQHTMHPDGDDSAYQSNADSLGTCDGPMASRRWSCMHADGLSAIWFPTFFLKKSFMHSCSCIHDDCGEREKQWKKYGSAVDHDQLLVRHIAQENEIYKKNKNVCKTLYTVGAPINRRGGVFQHTRHLVHAWGWGRTSHTMNVRSPIRFCSATKNYSMLLSLLLFLLLFLSLPQYQAKPPLFVLWVGSLPTYSLCWCTVLWESFGTLQALFASMQEQISSS